MISQRKRIWLILAAFVFCFWSCGSDDSGSPETQGQQQTNPAPDPADSARTQDPGDPASVPCEAGDPNAVSPIWSHRVYRAFSSDGYTFEPENVVLVDHASFPEGVIGPNCRMRVYFVNGEPGRHGVFFAEESLVS